MLRVEKILEEDSEEPRLHDDQAQHAANRGGSSGKGSYKLYLGDGEIMIQALLAPHLHPLIDLQETTEGSLIEVRDYSIRKAKRRRGEGEVVYLGVEDYVCITLSRPTTSEAHKDVLVNGGGFIVEEDTRIAPQPSSCIQVPSSPPAQEMPQQAHSSQESLAYETITVDPETVKRRRQALHELSSNTRPKRGREDAEHTPIKRQRLGIDEMTSNREPSPFETIEVHRETPKKRRLALHEPCSNTPLQREHDEHDEVTPTKHAESEAREDTADRTFPNNASGTISRAANSNITHVTSDPSAPLHTLDSLLHAPNPLPTKNYPVTIFAVISWISPNLIRRPGSPFPPKRILKLHDPSVTDRQVGVSISVFIDAATFTPRHSTIALFSGVVMQMYRDEVILNAYPSLRGSGWYIDDEEKLESMGYNVQGMRVWWEERKRVRAFALAGGGGSTVTKTGKPGSFSEHADTTVTGSDVKVD